jgi:uncharacterized lipoprotein YddW (UPF0748 family)/fibronectin type 3 domain-containing protein
MEKSFFLFLLILSIVSLVYSQQTYPKKEMRGVWVATVSNIDWPITVGSSTTSINKQKEELENIFIYHKNLGMNTIFFQVRTTGDAFYKSQYEPWSAYLTGTQGLAPSDPNYDPLQYAIELGKKYGIQVHAWINPYRLFLTTGNVSSVASNHLIKTKPEWVLKCDKTEYRFLNPGIPAVREYVTKIVMDIVRRYDVDGIHFDDYFYPYTDYGTFNDDDTYNTYKVGNLGKTEWRKNNVNLLLKMINDSIKAVKPHIIWGISPAGNPSVNGTIYCDPDAWLSGKYYNATGQLVTGQPYIDYILPQLYWADYKISGTSILPYWAGTSQVLLYGSYWGPLPLGNRDLYTGHGTYNVPTNIGSQIRINRANPNVKGGVHFSSKTLTGNLSGCSDTIKKYQPFLSIVPPMVWKDNSSPNAPLNFKWDNIPGTSVTGLVWDKPSGEDVKYYIVYAFDKNTPTQNDIDNPANILDITGNQYFQLKNQLGDKKYLFVTALDRYNNESGLSQYVSPSAPNSPVLVEPLNNFAFGRDTVLLKWRKAQNATGYSLKVATSQDLTSGIVANDISLNDTIYKLTNINGQTKYYWAVKSKGAVVNSDYSNIYNFTTAFPQIVTNLVPKHATTSVTYTNVKLAWSNVNTATKYRLQLATSNPPQTSTMVKDTTITDTTIVIPQLLANKAYFFRVKAINQYGEASWSTINGFQTAPLSNEIANNLSFILLQNYPNPFNPVTNITYTIPITANVKLTIYNSLGQVVKELINEYQNAGEYSIVFDGSELPSGTYFYRLTAGNFAKTNKMLLIK